MISFFEFVIALASIFKTSKSLLDDFSAYYVQKKIKEMKEENRIAIITAIKNHDQRSIEKVLGKNAGEPSHAAGSEIVDSLPGVGSTH